MPNFISDEEMAKLEASQKTPDFISDEEMTKIESGKPWYDISAEGLGRTALEALPIAGSIAGGLVGTAIAPIAGSIPGAGIGAAAGKSLEQTGKSLFFNEGPQTREAQYKGIIGEGLAGAAGEGAGQIIAKAVPMIVPLAKKGLTKVGQALTGVPEQEITTYAKNADKIKEMAKASDASTIEAADQIRMKYADDIKSTKQILNKTIESTLQNNTQVVSNNPILEALETYKSKINKDLYPEQISQIDDLISKINSTSVKGNLSLLKAHQVKQFLQDKASSAYSNPGEIFSLGSEAAKAAKDAAAKARNLVNQVAPEIAEANNQLSKLHNIEDSMNVNLLKIGKPEAGLLAAGSGGNARNAKALEKLGEMTGTPMLEEAQNLAAMRTFANPPLLPVDVTGKAGARMNFAKAGVGAIGGAIGAGPIGAAIGTALTSPAALKSVIDVGRKAGKVGTKALEFIPESIKNLGPGQQSKDLLYKTIMQKYMQNNPQEEEAPKIPDQGYIMEKIKGTPYEKILNNSLQSGGQQSFAAANYVLQNRDQNYRKLLESES
jgi:hypothetical protein